MNTPQRTHACAVAVDRETADVLRAQAKKIYVFNHELFEDFEAFCPEAQHALAMRFCDTTALLNTIGWDPDTTDTTADTIEVPLTDDLVEQLRHRRYDCAFTNKDRLDGLDVNQPIDPDLLAEITTDRLAAQALYRVIAKYETATSS
jgi:hypothetical protein